MPSFRTPRRPAVRPPSEVIERDDDSVVDAGAVKETAFVTQMLADLPIHVPAKRTVRRTFGAPSPFEKPAPARADDERARIKAMTDAEFEAFVAGEGFEMSHWFVDGWKEMRK
ncbi:MAG TPA: hypothetical protein VIL88_17820 [Devosia sp.]|jgi:hypothetical protein|uniref:hypothetical protein n=1 Tax=Devosia sp. TaxID=1871048 RepID=UPI002F931656